MKNWKNNQEVSDEPKYRLSMHSSFIPKIQTNASLQQLYKSQQLNSILRKGSVKTSETQRRISSSEKSLNLSSIKVQAKNDQQTINFDQSGNNFNKTSNSFKLQKDYVGSLKTRVKQLQKDDIQNQIKLQAAQRELALVRDHDNEMNIKLQSIESLLSNKLQSDDKTDRTINQIEMENIQLKLMKKQFEDQIIQKNHFIKEFKRLEKTYQNKIQELESNNKTLQLQNKELMKFSQTNKNYQDEQITIQNSLKLQIEELKENNQLLIQVLAVREKTIEEHNKQIQQKEESHQLKIQLQFKEKENLNNLYDIEQQKVLSLQQEIEKLNNLEQYRQHMDKKITQNVFKQYSIQLF